MIHLDYAWPIEAIWAAGVQTFNYYLCCYNDDRIMHIYPFNIFNNARTSSCLNFFLINCLSLLILLFNDVVSYCENPDVFLFYHQHYNENTHALYSPLY